MRTRKRAYHSEEKEEKFSSKFSDSSTQFEQSSKHTKRGRLAVSNNQSDMVNWQLYDQALLELLASVVENVDVSMGNKYDHDFFYHFAQKLTESVGKGITPAQCTKRLRELRYIFQTYEPQPQNYRHPSMPAELFRILLSRCFHVPKKPVRIPRLEPQRPRQCFSGNKRSSSGGSGSCSYSVAGVSTSVHREIPSPMSTHMGGYHQELVHTLNNLHSHHGLSTSCLIALSRFFSGGNNHMLAGILLEKVGPSEQMNFINQLNAAGVLNAPTDHA